MYSKSFSLIVNLLVVGVIASPISKGDGLSTNEAALDTVKGNNGPKIAPFMGFDNQPNTPNLKFRDDKASINAQSDKDSSKPNSQALDDKSNVKAQDDESSIKAQADKDRSKPNLETHDGKSNFKAQDDGSSIKAQTNIESSKKIYRRVMINPTSKPKPIKNLLSLITNTDIISPPNQIINYKST